jgi:SSS family solute:Na+ symporter
MYLQSALAYLTPPIVAVFLGGLFARSVNRQAAFYTLLTGSALAVLLLVMEPGLHFLYVAGLLFLASIGVMGGVSWGLPSPSEETNTVSMWRRRDLEMEPATVAITVLLLGAVAVTVGMLW